MRGSIFLKIKGVEMTDECCSCHFQKCQHLKFFNWKSLKYKCLKLMTFPFLSLFVIMTFPFLSLLSAYFQKCHYLYYSFILKINIKQIFLLILPLHLMVKAQNKIYLIQVYWFFFPMIINKAFKYIKV